MNKKKNYYIENTFDSIFLSAAKKKNEKKEKIWKRIVEKNSVMSIMYWLRLATEIRPHTHKMFVVESLPQITDI